MANDPDKKKSFPSLYESLTGNSSEDGQNGHVYPGLEDELGEEEEIYEDDDSSCVLTDEIDHKILMHRDAHFGGDFQVMINYYNLEESIGTHPDFDVERISYLAEVEKDIGEDLAPLILTGAEAEAVAKSRLAYARLKEIYAVEIIPNSFSNLIADLILSEDEEPLAEIEAVVSQGTRIVPELLALLKIDDLYDPLFPGYGYAPYLVILCLGKIQDASAITPLFETLSKPIVFDEMVVLEALAEIGDPSKHFLLKVLKSRPLTQDNSNAAFALTSFSDDLQVAVACFEQLQKPEVQETSLLRTYLVCNCEILKGTPYHSAFIDMAKNSRTPQELRKEMQMIIDEWDGKG